MKTFLLLYIALVTSLGFISQLLLFSPLGQILFVLLNFVCLPIITAFALKLYFSISIKPRFHH